ncbi:unnamed protein product [Trichogramma brassicae]|uniref:C2H2-type domain-containing protein n=1 Tax=Trichogramma brassicae TaxID=86971 RepID=A0A6H5IAX6_9HYME|nr:unnamed protein product [Trichogramma brassicae]
MLHALDAEDAAAAASDDPTVDRCDPLRADEAIIDLNCIEIGDSNSSQNYFYQQQEEMPSVELASLDELLSSMDRRLVELRNNEYFKCDLCETKYEKLSELEAHAKSHDQPDNYVCQVCFKSFHVLRIFNKHLRSAHPELPIELDKGSRPKPVLERAKRQPRRLESPRGSKSADWQCHLCKRKFVYQSILKRHVRSHTNERPFGCKLCEQRFFQRSHLSQHFVRCHTKGSGNRCADCEASFDTRQDFLRHYRSCHEKLEPLKHLLECDFCKKIFFDKSSLRRHIDAMHVQLQPRYSCEICDKKFKLECNLQNHMYTHTEEKMFGCPICGRKFSQKSVLQAHARRHTDDKPFQCEVCGLRFLEKLKFIGHTRRHTNERPFECGLCAKTFALKETLRRHEHAVHYAKPSYQCEICAKMFKQLVHLNVHKRVHSDERPFQCTVCKASFKYRALLKNHEDVHKNVRRYECFDCRATFVRKSNLRMHISGMHTKERPFHCTHCDKKFKQKSHLNGHLRTHTKALPFSCDICGHRCNRRDNLNKHIKTHDITRIVKRRAKKNTPSSENLIKLYGQ